MQRLRNTFKHIIYQLLASLSFFTRLPFWRLCDIPAEYYRRVVPFWQFSGIVTGGIMALAFSLSAQILPLGVSIVLAFAIRVVLTGGLHEDGFADFCDGFGGGTSRERTLEIMKDSHIGTYGVLGLVGYFFLLYNVMLSLVPLVAEGHDISEWQAGAVLLLLCDTISKSLSLRIIDELPYARNAAEAKNRLVYDKMTKAERIANIIYLLAAASLFFRFVCNNLLVLIAPLLMFYLLVFWMKRRINGYTGDCCGAMFIILELAIYLGALVYLSGYTHSL